MRLVRLFLLMVLAASVVACSPTGLPSSASATPSPVVKEPYKIGMVISLTGFATFPGTEVRDAAVMEVERINAAGGVNGHQLELLVEDSASDPTKAVAALTKLARQDKVLAVIGDTFSTIQPATRPIAAREQIVEIHIDPAVPELRSIGPKWSFNMAQSPELVAGAIIDILKAKGYKRVVALHDVEPVWDALAQNLAQRAPAEGIEVSVAPETFTPDSIDVTPQLTKIQPYIKEQKAEAMILLTNGATASVVGKNMKTLEMNLPLIGTHAFGFGFTIGLGGDVLDGVIFPAGKILLPDQLDDSDPQKQTIIEFKQRYQAKYDKEANQFTGHGYDAIHLLVEALKVAGSDRAKIRDALENVTNFVGMTGVYNFSPTDHEGLTRDALVIYQLKDKQFHLLSK